MLILICRQTIRESVKKYQDDFKTQVERMNTGHLVVPGLREGFVGLWVLCIIGVIVYFTRPVSTQNE